MSVVAAILAAGTGGGGSGSGNGALLIGVGLFMMAIAGVQVVRPQALWRLNRRFYKNPDAMEPSDLGFGLQRLIGAVAFCFGVAALVNGISKL
ncbi:hypothetical protein KSP35_05275 [Aquihabitans sp. G128]|uniref:DUF6199 family natural product biosynthesis protein n=1 Tax=Aquihabitans sp. G128 TaxID=2849779 RepID=UPI001C224D89|nr:DUF6199 family natural product biosynthesis protein [Aquihabitans sp. G128]QXC62222.1 hypothetical protein KSP35_05275 [Aquihabitans sp. G128]